MTAVRARGRPKGSGINDQHRLVEIGRLIAADSRMKPTTAIKALGISDPSTIRRLRDKYNLGQIGGQDPTAACAPAGMQGAVRTAALSTSEPVRKADADVESHLGPRPDPISPKASSAAPSAGAPQASPSTETRDEPAFPLAVALFGFGLNAATAIFEQQMSIAQSVLKLPQVRNLMRSQIAFTELMLDVTRPSPGPRTVH